MDCEDPAVQALVAEVAERLGPGPFKSWVGWPHMGAVVTDASLQAGLKWGAVVRPRVERLIATWPDPRLSAFENEIAIEGSLEEFLNFHGQKIDKIKALTAHLRTESSRDPSRFIPRGHRWDAGLIIMPWLPRRNG